jgi:hypothetical protein
MITISADARAHEGRRVEQQESRINGSSVTSRMKSPQIELLADERRPL